MECPNCGKSGAYTEENGYEILFRGNREAHFRCGDCDRSFWWP